MTKDASVTSDDETRPERHLVAVDGFDDFFAEHHDRIVRSLCLVLGDVHLGRDAASEGFARALQRWGRVGSYENPAGWIYRVGLNWARSRRRRTVREIPEFSASESRSSDGAVAAETSDRDLRILPALRRLSVDHRAVVVARYYLDYSEQQIATALDIRPGTVKSRLSRALERLADDLGTA
ncbi:sigma-70 family RNA polymerase sigma factor [Ilumatobacter nonamiensis]|uniref:sigma-70 family RNA polymerase sigma factor n=1 Tax=Ilumatobacter nonamiensis TaxID=467093 RepID=UPI000A2F5F49|nr:sigma-70 family RNA polymerase sigma factor [Ilumatobacter nonamiensis]